MRGEDKMCGWMPARQAGRQMPPLKPLAPRPSLNPQPSTRFHLLSPRQPSTLSPHPASPLTLSSRTPPSTLNPLPSPPHPGSTSSHATLTLTPPASSTRTPQPGSTSSHATLNLATLTLASPSLLNAHPRCRFQLLAHKTAKSDDYVALFGTKNPAAHAGGDSTYAGNSAIYANDYAPAKRNTEF